MSRLALKLECTAGSDLDLAVLDGIQLARQIGLAYVYFDANGANYTCYPDNRAMRLVDGQKGRYEYDGRAGHRFPLAWIFIPPVNQRGEGQ